MLGERQNAKRCGEVTFIKYQFNESQARSFFDNYRYTNLRPITRAILTWYAFSFDTQLLPNLEEKFDLKHIFPSKRQQMEHSLSDENSLDLLGNKILLEKSINIRASDYRFEDKKKIYSGEVRRGKNKEKSKVAEIDRIIAYDKFDEDDIKDRNKLILDAFFAFLREERLLQ
jgi:hypothetical protein